MDYKKVKQLLEELLEYLEKYGDGEFNYYIKQVKNSLVILNDLNESSEYSQELIDTLKTLFTPRGGISDFYIWNNGENDKLVINDPLSEIKHQLWEIIKVL